MGSGVGKRASLKLAREKSGAIKPPQKPTPPKPLIFMNINEEMDKFFKGYSPLGRKKSRRTYFINRPSRIMT
jgi:hypothetical protein